MVERTRTLGFKVAYAIGLGTMIAAGIFSLSGTAVARIGSSAVIAFVIAALVASITAASYSEFASIYSENGGGYLFSARTFESDFLTYAVGAMLFLGYTGTTAFYLATMDEWFQVFILPESWPVPHGAVGVVAAILLGGLNAQGTEESGTFQVLVTGAKVGVLFAFIGGAVSYAGPTAAITEFTTSFQAEFVNVLSVAALAFITFFGFSAIAASAGEIIEPRKTVPKAIAASIVTVTVLYALVIIAMVNTPPTIAGQPRAEVLQSGETAMGMVASAFLGSIGQSLIVAGAVFSMVSASNASILAASGIGNLMGQRGQAPRSFSRIHPDFGTPFWSVTAVTTTIVSLIVLFIGVFPAHRSALFGLHLGLSDLTGFATLNLLLPLSVVNVALVYSRRNFPDIDRPLTVPLVPVLPLVGVVANLALIGNLPRVGVGVGVAVNLVAFGVYRWWGGAPEVEDLISEAVPAHGLGRNGGTAAPTEAAGVGEGKASDASSGESFTVLVPVQRPVNAPGYAQLGARVAECFDRPTEIRLLNTTHVPDQTPSETVEATARERVQTLEEEVTDLDVGEATLSVEGHVCRDIAFDIVHTARDIEADRIVMGYPQERRSLTETVEYESPCDVLYASDIDTPVSLDSLTVGTGGGPHHDALVSFLGLAAELGSAIDVVNVTPSSGHGTAEDVDPTLQALGDDIEVTVHRIESETIADGLVDHAEANDHILFVAASRTRLLQRWALGSTPDRVIARARASDVPVVVYASTTGVAGRAEEVLFPVYRYLQKLVQ